MDMVKLSQQTPSVQREICDLLITGKTNAFKRALQQALLADWKDRKPKETVEFNIKERWGIPKSIMKFQRRIIIYRS